MYSVNVLFILIMSSFLWCRDPFNVSDEYQDKISHPIILETEKSIQVSQPEGFSESLEREWVIVRNNKEACFLKNTRTGAIRVVTHKELENKIPFNLEKAEGLGG